VTRAVTAVLLALAVLAPGRARATALDGFVLGVTPVVQRRPAALGFNVVILGDGFQSSELDAYAAVADDLAAGLLAMPPFTDCRTGLNLWRVDVTSTDSGIDVDLFDRRTFFDAYFFGRLILIDDTERVHALLDEQLPEWDVAVMVANSTLYGGAGYPNLAIASVGAGREVALHELGHSAFGLADEYDYYSFCDGDPDRDQHPPEEPVEPNVTVETDRALVKWADLILPDTPLPTTFNPECSVCDQRTESPFGPGTVGLFEGAHYFHCGAFRGEFTCRMRETVAPFCAVCRRRMSETLAPYASRCGEGVLDDACGEQCDDGNDDSGDGCDANCTPTACGNAILTAGEECDDGNRVDGDGCDANCRATSCGNGVVTAGEECDDGNGASGDGCDANCTPTACGNAIVTEGEECDDGNYIDRDSCDNNCRPTDCGDGVVNAGEDCDDGNGVSGDGCDTNCTPTACGNAIPTAGEECDDGNPIEGDDCDSNCTVTKCGNGVLTAGEDCDDGNVVGDDGCSADCFFECTAAAECSDGDTCSADDCVAQRCVHGFLTSFENAICRVGQLREALCAPAALPRSLERTVAKQVTTVEDCLETARNKPSKVARMLKRADKALAVIRTKTRRAVRKRRLSAECAAAIVQAVEARRALLGGLGTP
jgi:cysteine-rich repeat protein